MSQCFQVSEPEAGLKSLEFKKHRLTIDGYSIPFMEGQIVKGEHAKCAEHPEQEMWYFSLANGCSVEVPLLYGHSVAWFVANAMAYAAGYSGFGEHSQPLNQFKRRLSRLEMVPEIETLTTEGQLS